jgi:hypothetical protein
MLYSKKNLWLTYPLVRNLEYNLLLRSLRGPAALAAGLSPDELHMLRRY